jgi:hypothetical protein
MATIEVNDNWYESVLSKLVREMTIGTCYFTGTISGSRDGIDWALKSSVVVHRDDFHNITEFNPMYWEFHTGIHGKEIANDFAFSNLNKLL